MLSPKQTIKAYLYFCRRALKRGSVDAAKFWLHYARELIDAAPASTRRRWRCGQ